ncbi:hypothetical protein [Winogradskyella sp.]|uniref:hypothetical protein n=1 Tax=Winogradskyella sp. TaxID=1883156 RepID=UPI003BA88323
MLDIVKDLGFSERKFELSIGKSNGYINGMRKRNSSPTVDVLFDIVKKYPQFNINWILTGEGSMKVDRSLVNEPRSSYSKDKIDLQRIWAQNNVIIDNLKDLNEKVERVESYNKDSMERNDERLEKLEFIQQRLQMLQIVDDLEDGKDKDHREGNG